MTKESSLTPALRVLLSPRPVMIAHRGFSALAPENTMPAFELALQAGADLVEFDARATSDGVLLAIHDHELDRTTDVVRRWRRRHNRIDAKSIAEIESLDAGTWFERKFAGTKIPSISEAVRLIRNGGSIPLIERKAGDSASYLSFLRQSNLIDTVIVQSFDWNFLSELHHSEPALTLGALGPAHLLPGGRRPLGISRKLNAAWLNQLQRTGARVVVWNRQVSKGAVRLAHERGLKVWVYTINDLKLGRHLLAAGVDGLITNDPILLSRITIL